METKKIKELKNGEFFRLIKNNVVCSPVWVRGEYDRTTKSYCCYKFDDVNTWKMIKATKQVNVNFEF